MAEHGRRRDHAGVIPAAVHLEVRAAGECSFDTDAHFAGLQGGLIPFFNPDILLTMKDGGFQLDFPLVEASLGPAMRSRMSTNPAPASISSRA